MLIKNSDSRYSAALIGLHWLTAVLLVFVYAAMELRDLAPRGSGARELMKQFHFMLGLSLLPTVLARILVRWGAGAAPAVKPSIPLWQARLATAVHVTLYLFLFCMPLLGWLTLSASAKNIPFFGFSLPPLVSASAPLADRLKDLHETLASLGYVLIGLHAAAALAHHYLVKDNTLQRMLPAANR